MDPEDILRWSGGQCTGRATLASEANKYRLLLHGMDLYLWCSRCWRVRRVERERERERTSGRQNTRNVQEGRGYSLLEMRPAFASTSDPSGSRRATNRVTAQEPRPKSLGSLLFLPSFLPSYSLSSDTTTEATPALPVVVTGFFSLLFAPVSPGPAEEHHSNNQLSTITRRGGTRWTNEERERGEERGSKEREREGENESQARGTNPV